MIPGGLVRVLSPQIDRTSEGLEVGGGHADWKADCGLASVGGHTSHSRSVIIEKRGVLRASQIDP